MEKTCPLYFDVECGKIYECSIPRLARKCQHLAVDINSRRVFMGYPVENCTVSCQRTNHLFNEQELETLANCTRERFKNNSCPKSG